MHIKKLEIAGFKSFVDRTVIHFDHDVIGVVGPNGCGKSNIVDAIRWCLGEQSAKHLRGRAMEDVIFNGSESRGPAGLAEVTITFDNTNPEYAASLPIEFRDYPEIAVTRRLFRDGTSEYLINKTQVRLRDVTELFLGTGVGTKAYSIVEQGRIGQIVSARAEDRRLFIEEAAGITKYSQRRKQAERKMELTRINLARISDIVAEIDRGRASLKRQVAKAERFLEYRRELDDLVLHERQPSLARAHRRAPRGARRLRRGRRPHRWHARAALREADGLIEEVRRESALSETRTDEASRLAFDADNSVSALHAELDRLRDRLTHLSTRLDSGRIEIEVDRRADGRARDGARSARRAHDRARGRTSAHAKPTPCPRPKPSAHCKPRKRAPVKRCSAAPAVRRAQRAVRVARSAPRRHRSAREGRAEPRRAADPGARIRRFGTHDHDGAQNRARTQPRRTGRGQAHERRRAPGARDGVRDAEDAAPARDRTDARCAEERDLRQAEPPAARWRSCHRRLEGVGHGRQGAGRPRPIRACSAWSPTAWRCRRS